MKKLLFILLLPALFCIHVCAQSNSSPCPVIYVTGPSKVPQANEVITFTAKIDGKVEGAAPGYRWSISSGELLEGQGTREIKVRTNALNSGVSAIVEISGLAEGCQNLASEVASGDRWEAVQVDEIVVGCPKVAVETSPVAVIDGYPMVFSAKVTGADKSKLRYRWTLSNGEILEGQGTAEIKVDTLGYQGEKIKASVTITGLSKRCGNRASATGFVKPKPYLN